MRILATLAIIFIHVSQSFISTVDSTNSFEWWTANLYLSFTVWGVLVFVMISGALLLLPERKYLGLASFYKKRISRLLLPILFWTIFYLFWSYLKSAVLEEDFKFDEMFANLLSGRPFYHMWYLYMAIGLYIFTPYLRKIVKHSTNVRFLYYL